MKGNAPTEAAPAAAEWYVLCTRGVLLTPTHTHTTACEECTLYCCFIPKVTHSPANNGPRQTSTLNHSYQKHVVLQTEGPLACLCDLQDVSYRGEKAPVKWK